MPLTSVVEYLNDRLHQLHPTARLSAQAGFRYRQGRLSAGIAGFRLLPHQRPVLRRRDGQVAAYSAQLHVESSRGHPMKTEALYVHAWDAEDVVFLDRFLRILHALHHLNVGHDGGEWLVLGVHLRHVSAVSEQHGQVFQDLLRRLGLTPGQVVLRLSSRALHQDAHVQSAARSFAACGYRLLASRPDIQDTDWALLRELGVRWVAPDLSAAAVHGDRKALEAWGRQAEGQGIGCWADGIASARDLALAHALGAELVEGDYLRELEVLRLEAS